MAINLANNSSLANITALPSSISGGGMTLISEQTASGSATISFTSGIDDTYDSYVFKFINIHAETDSTHFSFQANVAGGSGYNETITSTMFRSQHGEDDGSAQLDYDDNGYDLAQATGFQKLNQNLGNGADESLAGYLHLFNPSSTTFVKHFISRTSAYHPSDRALDTYVAGYFNITSAINEIQFKMSSGNIDSGVIKLYGIS